MSVLSAAGVCGLFNDETHLTLRNTSRWRETGESGTAMDTSWIEKPKPMQRELAFDVMKTK